MQRLREDGDEVKVLTRSELAADKVRRAGAVPVRGDITRPGAWQEELSSADIIFHGAGYVDDWGPRREFFRVNVGGTRNVLEALRGWRGHFIHLSSIAVHGFRPGTYTEDSPATRVRHPYCDSKSVAEGLVESAIAGGLKAAIVRISGVYGPGDPHFLNRFLKQARTGVVYVVGKGNQPTNLIYIEDVIEGLRLIAHREAETGKRYILSDPSAPDVLGLVTLAIRALDLRVRILRVPMWLAYPIAAWQEVRGHLTRSHPAFTRYAVISAGHACSFSMEATKRSLSWSPRVDIREGIARTIAWYKTATSLS